MRNWIIKWLGLQEYTPCNHKYELVETIINRIPLMRRSGSFYFNLNPILQTQKTYVSRCTICGKMVHYKAPIL